MSGYAARNPKPTKGSPFSPKSRLRLDGSTPWLLRAMLMDNRRMFARSERPKLMFWSSFGIGRNSFKFRPKLQIQKIGQ